MTRRTSRAELAYSQVFTIVYLFIGLGVVVAFLTSMAHHYMKHKIEVAGVRRSI